MICACGHKTSVDDTDRNNPSGTIVKRYRVCQGPQAHRFRTLERATDSGELDHVLVRSSASGRLTGPFDGEKLRQDVSTGVLRQMEDEAVRDLVEAVIFEIDASLGRLTEPLSQAERRYHPNFRLALTDVVIRDVVEAHLRRVRTRMPHVLYALSTRGRTDQQPGRQGFSDAAAVLHWLGSEENYPDLDPGPLPENQPTAADRWWPPASPPAPLWVVKRDRSESPEPFSPGKYRHSISLAMAGRPDAKRSSANVARWVLWGLAGQQRVYSGQLAVGTMDCLRRIDDVAYLRWAAIAKSVTSVEDFRDEALGLLTHPSTRLLFEQPVLRSGAAGGGGPASRVGPVERPADATDHRPH